jgi:alpha-galactosidase
MLVSKDKLKAHITVMRPLAMSNQEIIRVYPKGLNAKARYYIPELEMELSGDTLMQVGLVAQLQWGDFATKTFTLECVKK